MMAKDPTQTATKVATKKVEKKVEEIVEKIEDKTPAKKVATPKPAAKKTAAKEPKPATRKEPETKTRMHQVIRTISRDNSARGGSHTLESIEAYLNSYFDAGWDLKDTHYLGELPEGYVMLYVLARKWS